ncbi:hypothetical protein [Pseudarthrobacter oxydans]|uniref:hypothetical protein n=1 Tax=Pseudarthrobacter oxydans TaxID=1671 RepID=UPI00341C4C4B
MAWTGTQGYIRLWSAVNSASRVIQHESFPAKFTSPVVANLIREVFGVLEEVISNERFRAVDTAVVGNSAGTETAWTWLDNPSSAELTGILEQLTDIAYERSKVEARVLSAFRQAVGRVLRAVFDDLNDMRSPLAQNAIPPVRVALNRLDELEREEVSRLLDDAVINIQRNQEKAEAAASAASTAAGLTGDALMSSFYSELTKSEKSAANTFRWLTVFLLLVATGMALFFVLGHGSGIPWLDTASDGEAYATLIQRAILLAGTFGLAGYLARQAHQHRSMANWAGSMAVQLKTFDTYVAAIDSSETKDELRKAFAARVFGEHPPIKGEPPVAPSAAAMDTAVEWAAKLTAGGK